MNYLRVSIFFGLGLTWAFHTNGQGEPASAGPSVLREGRWLKIGVTEKGIYKIDRPFLQAAGVDVSALDPRKLSMYGNGGGGMLPQSNAVSRPYDLQDNAIMVAGEADGRFDAADFILFFGNTPDAYSYEASCDCYSYEKNLYSDTTFYFLRLDGGGARRVEVADSAEESDVVVTDYDWLYAHERDVEKLGASGRLWFGEKFSSTDGFTRTFTVDGGFVPDTDVTFISSVAAQSVGISSFDVAVNSRNILSQELPDKGDDTYDPHGTMKIDTANIPVNSAGTDQWQVGYQFNRSSGNPSSGYLDYFFLQGKKQLEYLQKDLYFRNKETKDLSAATYAVSGASGITHVWDITDVVAPRQVNFKSTGAGIEFSVVQQGVHEFVAFAENSSRQPVSAKAVANQNLKDGHVPDLVVVTHKKFLGEANRFASFRSGHDNLEVKVVTIDQVVNEFSSGMQDVSALRDYMRYLYQLSPGKLKYLLLFGDCSYDYKGRIADHNFVPVYQSRESLDQIVSFSSDDYFGFLDDDEGEWVESAAGDHLLDIGIGRIPVINTKQATDIVNKIISYSTDAAALGDWRSDLYFLADDGDFNIHLRDADRLASYVDTAYAQFNINKIYLDSYKQQLVGSVQRSPQMYEAIKQAFHNGAFIVNYSGHGSATVLTDERVVRTDSITKWANGTRLPLFVTATCDFGRYDNPAQECGAENLMRNPNGGVIALLTTTRPVYAHTNYVLNQAFYRAVFRKTNGEYPRLGDVMKDTKNNSLRGPVNRNFALLGDPSMRLNYPTYNLKITHLNGAPLDGVPDTVSAMNKVRVEGMVTDGVGNHIPEFEGKLTVTMYDKPGSFSTLGDESQPTTYEIWSNALFRGQVSIVEGAFVFEFVVPKHVSYQQTRGKIIMYAQPESGLADANGATIDFYMGGSRPPEYTDTEPPVIRAFINDRDFKVGQKVNPNPLLLVDMEDESGINISRKGVGQNITYQIDDEEPVILNDYYVADLDDFTKGQILFPLSTLAQGKHTLTVKAWDTFSNSSTTTINFVVSNDTKIKISNVLSYPNPATDQVIFKLEHDRGDHLLSIRLELIDQRGAVVDAMEWQANNSGGLVVSPSWNRNLNGRRIENGIYIYRLFVTDEQDGNQNFAFGKLILTN